MQFTHEVVSESGKWVYDSYAKAVDFACFLDDSGEDCEVISLTTKKVEWASYWADHENEWERW